MDKFEGVQRAEIINVDYACEMTPQLRQNQKGKPGKTVTPQSRQAENGKRDKILCVSKADNTQKTACADKPKNKQSYTWLRYAFCALILGVCLLGKFTAADKLKTASGFIKDELSKDYISELYDG